MTREEFEAQFYSRTLAYLPGFTPVQKPLVIVVGSGAHCPAGHALLVSLTNQVARACRRIVFVGEISQPLLCADVFRARTLGQATAGLARAINPFIDVSVVDSMPREQALLTIGIGTDVEVELSLGCDGWIALLGQRVQIGREPMAIWGALLSSCLGANVALQRILGVREGVSGAFSLWDQVQAGGLQGPAIYGPIDVGRVLQVGAGAVGSALNFFLCFFGISGTWTVADGDIVGVSNLNRQALFVAADAGFPAGEPVMKACRAAHVLGINASASPKWFGDDSAVVNANYDVVLALANDRGVRGALQHRQPTVLMHATTSRNWQAQVHRHVAGRDDCIDCRLPPEAPVFACATTVVESSPDQHHDASIPPLSAMAGLLLCAELAKLAGGALCAASHNFTAVDLYNPAPAVQRMTYHCHDGCDVRRPPSVRQSIDAHSRWVGLDGQRAVGG